MVGAINSGGSAINSWGPVIFITTAPPVFISTLRIPVIQNAFREGQSAVPVDQN